MRSSRSLLPGVLALSLLAPAGVIAQPRPAGPAPLAHYQFQRLAAREGLPENYVTALVQDREGFLWIGTQNGLVRYDGHTLRTFRERAASGKTGLQHVIALAEDHRSDVWAGGAFESGLWHLDRRTGRLTGYAHDPRNPATLSGNTLLEVAEATPGRIVAVTAPALTPALSCVDRLDVATGQVRRFRTLGGGCLSGYPTRLRDRERRVWIGTAAGVVRYDPRADSLVAFGAPELAPYPSYPALDALLRRARVLAAHRQPRDDEDRTQAFALAAPTRVLIVGGGELDTTARSDYGWIEDARGTVVWEMHASKSRWMGGNAANRLVVAAPTLPAGPYRLRFRSDGGESAARWSSPPARRDLWGVRVVVPDARDAAALGRLVTALPARKATDFPDVSAQPLGEEASGAVWFGTDGRGPVRWNNRTGRVEVLTPGAGPLDVPEALRLSRARVSDMLATPRAGLWFATDRGLYRLAGGRLTRYSFDDVPQGPGNTLSQIVDGRDGTLWLATGTGAVQFSIATGQWQRYPFDRINPTALGGYGITRMLRDRQGNLWVGTAYGGLHRLDRIAGRAQHFIRTPGQPGTLPSNGVWSLAEAPDGAVWAATDSGLVHLDLATGLATRPSNLPGKAYVLHTDTSGTLWVAHSGQNQLFRLDGRTGRLVAALRAPNDSAYSRTGAFRALSEGPAGTLWLSTGDVGLVRIDARTGVYQRFPVQRTPHPGTSDSLDQAEANGAFVDRRGTVWLGTDEGGLNRLDVRTGRFTSYFDRAAGVQGVQGIAEDRRGHLWFGTYMNGLLTLDPRTGALTRYGPDDGVPHYHVQNVVPDEAGMLWLNTPAGVSRFDPAAHTFRTFGPSDGVPSIGVPRAALRLHDGRLLFGGNEGVLLLDPQALAADGVRPLLALESLHYRTPAHPDSTQGLLGTPQIDLPYDAADVTLTFFGLEYARPDAVRYQYRLLRGRRDEAEPWTDGGNEGLARYASFTPGRYRFEVRAAGADGLWSAPTHVLLRVHPPWWRTWWAYVLYAAFAALLLVAAFRVLRIRVTRRERARVEQERAAAEREATRLRAEVAETAREAAATRAEAAEARLDAVGKELAVAQRIQQGALPKALPQIHGSEAVDVAARMIPAKEVGGDLYDFFWVDAGRLAFAIGDVSGKGVPAALFMALTRSALRAIAQTGLDPGTTLNRLNALLYDEAVRGMFVTLIYGVLDRFTGEATFASAGHMPPLLVRATGEVEAIMPPRSFALCLRREATFETCTVALAPGDTLLLYTDGVTEAMTAAREQFEEERLRDVLEAHVRTRPGALVAAVAEAVEAFTGGIPAHDDVTLLALRYNGVPDEDEEEPAYPAEAEQVS